MENDVVWVGICVAEPSEEIAASVESGVVIGCCVLTGVSVVMELSGIDV